MRRPCPTCERLRKRLPEPLRASLARIAQRWHAQYRERLEARRK